MLHRISLVRSTTLFAVLNRKENKTSGEFCNQHTGNGNTATEIQSIQKHAEQ